MPATVGLLAAVAVGCTIGFINGIITTKIGVPSFITTLGMMMVVRGLMLIFSKGFPEAFQAKRGLVDVFTGQVGKIPVQFFWFIFSAFIVWVILENTRFGNWTYVTGGNKIDAIEMGIPGRLIKNDGDFL